MSLRRPLQVWLPRRGVDLGKATALDHVQYGYCAYQDEGVVRFDGAVTSDRRRPIEGTPFWERTVPGEIGMSLEVEVFHIGRNGYVWGPDCADRFPNSSVEGLLQSWLLFEARGGESADAWASPLANLLPSEGAGPIESRVRRQMAEIANGASGAVAMRAATDLAFPYIMEAYGSWLWVELAPTWVEKGRARSWLRMESEKLVPRDPELDKALSSQRSPKLDARLKAQLEKDPWRIDLLSQVPVRRCWGVPGLFWALLIDHFENRCGFNWCVRCGRPLPTSRTQCGMNDDPACFREGQRERKRSSRSRKPRRST
jgi:hypothetical protein